MDDYISREALLTEASGYDWVAGLKTVLKRINAADVRPVVRGKWKLVGLVFPMYECDQCHAISLGGNFCPNCGADMKEDRKE